MFEALKNDHGWPGDFSINSPARKQSGCETDIYAGFGFHSQRESKSGIESFVRLCRYPTCIRFTELPWAALFIYFANNCAPPGAIVYRASVQQPRTAHRKSCASVPLDSCHYLHRQTLTLVRKHRTTLAANATQGTTPSLWVLASGVPHAKRQSCLQ